MDCSLDEFVLVCDHAASGLNGLHSLVENVVWRILWVCDDDGLLRDHRGQDSHDDSEECED